MKVLHVSPHPDDEMLGAPATLLALQREGHQVTNFACSLGGLGQRRRRKMELEEACSRTGWGLLLADPMTDLKKPEDDQQVLKSLQHLEENYDIIVSPALHDLHPGHEAVARGVREFVRSQPHLVWWQWGLWGDLPLPSIFHPFEESDLKTVLWGLEAHQGEIDRNDYLRFYKSRAEMNSVLGPEKCFGFGSEGFSSSMAEILCEVRLQEDRWILGAPKVLDPANPLQENDDFKPRGFLRGHSPKNPLLQPDITAWIESDSLTETLRATKQHSAS